MPPRRHDGGIVRTPRKDRAGEGGGRMGYGDPTAAAAALAAP